MVSRPDPPSPVQLFIILLPKTCERISKVYCWIETKARSLHRSIRHPTFAIIVPLSLAMFGPIGIYVGGVIGAIATFAWLATTRSLRQYSILNRFMISVVLNLSFWGVLGYLAYKFSPQVPVEEIADKVVERLKKLDTNQRKPEPPPMIQAKEETKLEPTKPKPEEKPILSEESRLKEKLETKVFRKSEQTPVEKPKPESPKEMEKAKQQIPLLPPKLAQLLFSFPSRNRQDIPVTVTKVPFRDGVAKVEFTVVNLSDMSAIGPEIWVKICLGCAYAKEPEGFLKLSGADEHDRYKVFNALNPTVALQTMTVEIIPPKDVEDRFQISFKYACQTCGVVNYWQTFDVLLER